MARLPYLKRSDLLSSEQHYYDEISEKRDFYEYWSKQKGVNTITIFPDR